MRSPQADAYKRTSSQLSRLIPQHPRTVLTSTALPTPVQNTEVTGQYRYYRNITRYREINGYTDVNGYRQRGQKVQVVISKCTGKLKGYRKSKGTDKLKNIQKLNVRRSQRVHRGQEVPVQRSQRYREGMLYQYRIGKGYREVQEN
jgi:hypothetical protein